MNRIAMGAVCVAVGVFSVVGAKRARRALSAFAFEQVERMFDVVENVFHVA